MYRITVFLQSPLDGNGAETRLAALRKFAPALLGYVESRPLPQQLDDAQPPFTALAELYFAQAEPALAATQAAGALEKALQATEAAAEVLLGWERTVMRLPEHQVGRGIKITFPFLRMAGLSVADFQHHWWHRHGPIAAVTVGARCYMQYHPLPQAYEGSTPPYDAITELYFDNRADAVTAMNSDQMLEDQTDDARTFVDMDSVKPVLLQEQVLLAP